MSDTTSVVVDRRRSLLDRHRINTEDCMLRGFVNLFWMVILFFAFTSILRTFRHTGHIITMDLINTTMSGYFGLVALGVDMLMVFVVHCGLYWAAVPWMLPIVHSAAVWLVLQKTSGLAPLTTMAYLIMAIAFQMKFYSFTVTFAERRAHCKSRPNKNTKTPNGTLQDYLFHMVSPNIVYEPAPPRLHQVDYGRLWEKVSGTVFCWISAHFVIEQYLLPELKKVRAAPNYETILLDIYPSIFIPCIVVYLLLFLMMFEFWLCALATSLRMEECVFFADWWNSYSFADFSRKWNIPVHAFIKQHIYVPLMVRTGNNRRWANFACFFVSATLHEFVMWAGLGQRKRHPPIIFFFQLLQIPLTEVGVFLAQCSPFVANMFFWFGMIFGPPLITILYIRL